MVIMALHGFNAISSDSALSFMVQYIASICDVVSNMMCLVLITPILWRFRNTMTGLVKKLLDPVVMLAPGSDAQDKQRRLVTNSNKPKISMHPAN